MKINLLENERKQGIAFNDVESGAFFVGVIKDDSGDNKHRRLYYKCNAEQFIAMSYANGNSWRDSFIMNEQDFIDSGEYIERKFTVDKWEY